VTKGKWNKQNLGDPASFSASYWCCC